MNPIVVRNEALLLAGVSGQLPSRSTPPPARPQMIQELWQKLQSKVSDVRSRIGGERYAVIENDVLETGATPIYRAMIAVSTFAGLPAWCEMLTVRPGRFAVFEHLGPARDFSKTVAKLHVDWLGKIPGLFTIDWEMTVLPEGYDPLDSGAKFAYWLPLPPME